MFLFNTCSCWRKGSDVHWKGDSAEVVLTKSDSDEAQHAGF